MSAETASRGIVIAITLGAIAWLAGLGIVIVVTR